MGTPIDGAGTARGTLLATGVVVGLSCLLVACGGSDGEGGGPSGAPVIVATNSIWADVAGNVACDGAAEVVSLLPPGTDPHAFEPSMADRARLQEASLVVANGLGLEEGLGDTLESVEADGVPVFVAGDHVEVRPLSADAALGAEGGSSDADRPAGGGDGASHDHDEGDPHLWQDPTRVAEVVAALGEALVEEAGLDATAVRRCVERYTAELATLDEEVEAMVAAVPVDRRVLVTNHDALGYFADRYGFEVLGTVIPGPGTLAETNPAEIEALAQAVEESEVPAVFAEEQHSDADARALAERVGEVEVVTLHTDALGEEGSGAETYVAMIRRNGELVAAALGGAGS